MMIPTIHLNGTSRIALLAAHMEAGRKLRAAIDALRETAPHGRDYYPQGNGAISVAMREYQSRLDRLQGVLKELQDIAEAIDA